MIQIAIAVGVIWATLAALLFVVLYVRAVKLGRLDGPSVGAVDKRRAMGGRPITAEDR